MFPADKKTDLNVEFSVCLLQPSWKLILYGDVRENMFQFLHVFYLIQVDYAA